MRSFLKAVVLVPIAILAIAFAIANRQVVSISFDPFSASEPAFALVAPLFLLVFLLLMAGVLLGGVAAWLGQGRYRAAVKRVQADADEAHAEVERLRTELTIQTRRAAEGGRKALPAAMAAYEA